MEFFLKRKRFRWKLVPEVPKEGVSIESRSGLCSSFVRNPVLKYLRLIYFTRDVVTPFPFLCLLCGNPDEKVVL
jgi:hypothetical protein